MNPIPGRLEIDKDGKVTGPAHISHNDPWPCVNGTPGGSGKMLGVVMHTMDGTYQGTISWFNNRAAQASAFFAVSNTGEIWQFGPVGHDWEAWAQAAGNPSWYSIEHEDDQDPSRPLTGDQITASAQLLEVLSRYAGFALQITDQTNTPGYGIHSMGGVAWGDHPACPGPVRAAQRGDIVRLATRIRSGDQTDPAPKPDPPKPSELEGILVVLPAGTARKVLSADGGRTWG